MADLPILNAAGLYTSANEFSSVPEGALSVADNVVIRYPNVIEPRRGRVKWGDLSATGAHAIFEYGGTHLVHHNTTNLSRENASVYSAYSGSYAAPQATLLRMKGAEAQQNFYFTTSEGVYCLDSISGTPYKAGVVGADVPSLSVVAGSWFTTGTAVAYRIVWCRKDANGQLHLGAPSGRAVIDNTSGGTRAVQLNISIPSDATTSWFYRIYRSEMSATATTTPSDELFLVYENSPTSAQITAGYVQLTDTQPEILLNYGSVTTLYTNPSAGGSLQANNRPPLARDLAVWNHRLWYANTTQPQRLEFQLLTEPANNDALTIFGQTYIAETASPSYEGWQIAYGGAWTSAQKIEHAAQRLVYTINLRNKLGSSTHGYGFLRAYYISGAEESPGRVLVEATNFTQAAGYLGISGAWAATVINPIPDTAVAVTEASTARVGSTVTVTTGSAHGLVPGDSVVLSHTNTHAINVTYFDGSDTNFPPGIKTVATTPTGTTFTYTEAGAVATMTGTYIVHKASKVASSNDRAQNRIYYSKSQEPEAVPLTNYLDVGVKNQAIYRIVPLRDRLYVFKPDGVFVVTGEYPYRVDLLDDTTKILAADTAVPVSNAIYAWTNQGVVAVSDAGVKIVSRPIERTLDVATRSFAVSYETDRSYLLWLAISDESETCNQAYVYNILTNAWTRWDWTASCGRVVTSVGRLYTGHPTTTAMYRERAGAGGASGIYTTYMDEALLSPPTSISSTTTTSAGLLQCVLSANPTAAGVAEGDYVLTSGGGYGIVESASTNAIVLKVYSGSIAATQTLWVYRAIACEARWVSQAPEGPATIKQFSEATFHFDSANFYDGVGTFASELDASQGEVPIVFSDRLSTFAAGPGAREMPRNKRVVVSSAHQVCGCLAPGFSITEGGSLWALNGVTLHINDSSTTNSR
jgi:hypothetical protein